MGGIPSTEPETRQQGIVVLLVDDQAIVGEAIKRMLADQIGRASCRERV